MLPEHVQLGLFLQSHLLFLALKESLPATEQLRLVHDHKLSVLENLHLVDAESLFEFLNSLQALSLLRQRLLRKRPLKRHLRDPILVVPNLQVLRSLPVVRIQLGTSFLESFLDPIEHASSRCSLILLLSKELLKAFLFVL